MFGEREVDDVLVIRHRGGELSVHHGTNDDEDSTVRIGFRPIAIQVHLGDRIVTVADGQMDFWTVSMFPHREHKDFESVARLAHESGGGIIYQFYSGHRNGWFPYLVSSDKIGMDLVTGMCAVHQMALPSWNRYRGPVSEVVRWVREGDGWLATVR